MPYDLPNDLKLRILENYEILEQLQMWAEPWSSAQAPSKKLNFGNSSQKHAKVDIKLFLSCLVLLNFSNLFRILCSGMFEQQNVWSYLTPSHFNYLTFFVTLKHLPSL